MRKFFTLLSLLTAMTVSAQHVTSKWELSDPESQGTSTVTGDEAASALLHTSYAAGSSIARIESVARSGAAADYTAVDYVPPFAAHYVTTKVTSRTAQHNVAFAVGAEAGHTFKPTKISFDACKIGTDGGNIDVCVKLSGGTETVVASAVAPLRNRIDAGNSTGFSHHEFVINDVIADGKDFLVIIYIYNINGVDNSSPKSIGLRNIVVEGAVDEGIFTAEHYVSSFTFTAPDGQTVDLTSALNGLKNGATYAYPERLTAAPQNLNVVCKAGYTASVEMNGTVATVTVKEGDTEVFAFNVRFTVKTTVDKPEAKPLNRGLMAVSLSGAGMGSGNLVSWRHREADGTGVKYKLLRGTSPDVQNERLYRGYYIIDKTNYLDASGTADHYYKLEVYDKYGNLLETEVSKKTWENQTMEIPISAPVDTKHGALYNPNDASFCDMDGDGEYEIVLKWSPSNEKDAASTGTTSNPIFDCYKLDGTQLWRIDLGPNFFTSAHTIQFIAWDFDGDGYGEFMCKTAPGTIDGQGNYVVMGDDDPNANWLNGRGKQVEGPEYITVFDGMTGAELATIPYHTPYAAGASAWGDSNQNRSERYLAGLAYLDGYDANPSPIFLRGYYAGSFVAAYDWDGVNLTERWVSRNTQSGQGLYGEGAHWMSIGDVDGDGYQEITVGSAALDHDGSLLYRTGLGHGDALHLGDFLTEREGMELFMVHEKSPYGYDLRDAATGELIRHVTASGDTGRGLAAHFDSEEPSAQCLYSASPSMFNLDTGAVNGETWAIGSSGAGINNRIYWDGDLYDEYFDKSIIAHWNHQTRGFDRYKVNNTFYTAGSLNNGTKFNPCVLGDILGDWREEIITHNGTFEKNSNVVVTPATALIINATSYTSDYRIPHLMDDPQYRVQVVNQNCTYNQPPHLSFDPAVKYKGNPNVATMKDEATTGVEDLRVDQEEPAIEGIYTLQGVRLDRVTTPGIYIINGKTTLVK